MGWNGIETKLVLAGLIAFVACVWGCSDDIEPDNRWEFQQQEDGPDAASEEDSEGGDASSGDVTGETGDVSDAGDDETWETHDNRGICEMNTNDDPQQPCDAGENVVARGACDVDGEVFFDGERCRPIEECDCEGDQPCVIFETREDCAEDCAAAGWCDESVMPGASGLMCPDDDCLFGDMHVCVGAEDDPAGKLESYTGRDVVCHEPGDVSQWKCEGQFWEEAGSACAEDDWCCGLDDTAGYSEAVFRDVCELTLLPEVGQFTCRPDLE